MNFKKILGVVAAAYATSVAIAMKKRKDEGTSKLASDAKNSTLENVVDEITEIHKNAFVTVKNFVVTNFEDIKDVETLKIRLTEMASDFKSQVEKTFEDLKNNSEDYKDAAKKFLEDAYEKTKNSLKVAEEKAKTFGEDKKDSAEKFLAESKKKLEETYENLKTKFSK